MNAQVDVAGIWDKVVDRIKHKVIHPTLWRSLEIAAPIAAENGQFVVGFLPGSFHMSGNLLASEHKNAIENALKEFTGAPYTLRVIEGDSPEDWEHVKFKDISVERIRESERLKRDQERAVSQSWEGLLEQISRKYATQPLRQLPQSRAKYLKNVLLAISDAMDELMPQGERVDELAERSLARAIEKAGQLADVPGPIVALELFRLRGGRD